MERSTRTPSLSGIAGILIGIVALGGVGVFRWLEGGSANLLRDGILAALTTLLLAISLALHFSYRMAQRQRLPLRSRPLDLVVIELSIPLAAGGAFCIALLLQGLFSYLPFAMLTFYGLGLVSASKFAVREVRWLGLTELLLGICSAFVPGWGPGLWATGFGGAHILYGVRIYLRYEK